MTKLRWTRLKSSHREIGRRSAGNQSQIRLSLRRGFLTLLGGGSRSGRWLVNGSLVGNSALAAGRGHRARRGSGFLPVHSYDFEAVLVPKTASTSTLHRSKSFIQFFVCFV